MSQKIQKRIKETSNLYENTLQSNLEEFTSKTKSDESLFTVDRTGSKGIRKRIIKEVLPILKGEFISETEKKLIQKRIKTQIKKPYTKFYTTTNNLAINNLWEDEINENLNDLSNKSSKTRNLQVALPGQSYNPSEDDHQNALAEAVALQLKKEEPSNLQQNIIENETVDLVKIETYGEINSEDSDFEIADDHTLCTNIKSRKTIVKFTKAQRNKIRAKNIANFEKSKNLTDQQILTSIDILPNLLNEIQVQEEHTDNHEHKQLNNDRSKVNLSYYDVGTVPLSDELNGTLRQVIPKGVALFERESTMKQLGDLNTRNQRSRRAYEKPHGPKRIVWVAKYKYV